MPSLALAQKLLGRAAGVVEDAAAAPAAPETEAALGDALLALVAQARARGWDAERALRDRLRRLTQEVRAAEATAGEAEGDLPR
jgi:XTP/dITP diphosphohydrolase